MTKPTSAVPFIRQAELNDLPRLTEIYNHYILTTPITFDIEAYTVVQRQLWFDQFASTGRHRLYVAVEDNDVVGFGGTTQFRAKRAYDTTVETTIYCAPESTGRGIGTALYRQLFDGLRAEEVHLAVAGITLPNTASVALHERFGFASTGVLHEVGRKFDRYWDVAWYEKVLLG
jgi:phosphinothricin acetyltransferase